MPRPSKPARLWQKPSDPSLPWIILDGPKYIRTGHCGESGRKAAEQALADYIRTRVIKREGPSDPLDMTVGEALDLYANDVGRTVASPAAIAYAIIGLSPFWGDRPCSDVIGSNCRLYSKDRMKPRTGRDGRVRTAGPGTVRKELGVLQAALNYVHAEGKLKYAPKVSLIGQNVIRDRWLTRAEAARLLTASSPHLRRYILIALGTGTRSAAILGLRWGPSISSGWVDLDAGIMHRRGAAERETNKRRGSIRPTDKLLGHMRRWSRRGGTHVIQYSNAPVTSIKSAFAAACDRAGLEGVTPHTLKHTAVTWFFQNGGTIEDAADWFDTTAVTLQRVYRQHSPHYQDRARAVASRRGNKAGTV